MIVAKEGRRPPVLDTWFAQPSAANMSLLANQILEYQQNNQNALIGGYRSGGSTPQAQQLNADLAAYSSIAVMATGGRIGQTGVSPEDIRGVAELNAPVYKGKQLPALTQAGLKAINDQKTAYLAAHPLLGEYLGWLSGNPGGTIDGFLAQRHR